MSEFLPLVFKDRQDNKDQAFNRRQANLALLDEGNVDEDGDDANSNAPVNDDADSQYWA